MLARSFLTLLQLNHTQAAPPLTLLASEGKQPNVLKKKLLLSNGRIYHILEALVRPTAAYAPISVARVSIGCVHPKMR